MNLNDPRARGRLQFVLLATLFFAPMLFAALLYFGFPEWRPGGTVNFGSLVTPARPVDEAGLRLTDGQGEERSATALHGKWTLVLLAHEDCDASCSAQLLLTRQLRIALNDKRERVRRVLVLSSPEARDHVLAELGDRREDLLVLADEGAAGRRMSDFFNAGGAAPTRGALFLFDPLGNWMMCYPLDTDTQRAFKGLQKDFKKLLNVSQIG